MPMSYSYGSIELCFSLEILAEPDAFEKTGAEEAHILRFINTVLNFMQFKIIHYKFQFTNKQVREKNLLVIFMHLKYIFGR